MLGQVRQGWRNYKEDWIFRHKNVSKTLDLWIWFTFHLDRGRGFYLPYIELGKLIVYLYLAAAFIPWLGFLNGLEVLIVISAIVFFILFSQVLDLVHYGQKSAEMSNLRNYFIDEMREMKKTIRGESSDIGTGSKKAI